MILQNKGWRETIAAQGRILGAVLLQDMRTRFGRSYTSYLIAIAWPLCHIFVILAAYLLVNSFAPIGEDPAVFLTTGILPYILCLYPSRMLGYALLQNKQLLNIPILRPIHLIVARLLVELTTAALVVLLVYVTLGVAGFDIWPNDPAVAAQAICATLYLAVGFGVLNVVLVSLLGPFVIVGFVLMMLGLYITSGIFLPVQMASDSMRSLMSYNPICNLVEWMRSAYFSSYDVNTVNKGLVIGTASVTLLLGLLGERFMRNKLLT